ncbi:putative molybdopterin biosynthesis protein [Methanococcoides vulcani]|uniref:Putative molybdopterin biosynthesis protein n=1 Tax=Methanococcoides vulcani TaxID=1353158 RepID=A0A1I0ALI6_9EURY|nr:gephyrin-like molybdotransferase Glp [Methanococcoides vulcani]SES95182.1 putative molybdopterin biosynthesis protein [Methanococcoides vulcani]
MPRKILRDLLSIEDARRLFGGLDVLSHVRSMPIETATGRVLAEDIISAIAVPDFDKSLKDGYAVRSEDLLSAKEGPVALRLVGFSPVGQLPQYRVNEMEAAEIATGGPIPEGADAVVMVEDTELKGDNVLVKVTASADQNLIHAGMDVAKGERVLRKGTRIGAREVGVFASIGKRNVDVRSMKVGIISTGNELTVPGGPLDPGMIYDCNSYSLYASVTDSGADAVPYGIVRDDRAAVREAVDRAIAECDLVLTSGSTSAGPDDFMYNIIEEKGELLAHGLNFKPGKPVIIGIIDEIPIVALPGHPTASLTVFYEFLLPLVRRCLGASEPVKQRTTAVLGEDVISETRHELHAVRLEGDMVYSVNKSSASITTLAAADGFIEIPAGELMVREGTEVEVILFDGVCR